MSLNFRHSHKFDKLYLNKKKKNDEIVCKNTLPCSYFENAKKKKIITIFAQFFDNH